MKAVLPPFGASKYEALIDTLPEQASDATCCGENGCDGYGHVHGESGMRACINRLKRTLCVGGTEPMLFKERRKQPGYTETVSVQAVRHASCQSDEPGRGLIFHTNLRNRGKASTLPSLRVSHFFEVAIDFVS